MFIAGLIEAIIQFVLARGTEDVVDLLGWLSGSTYRISASHAIGWTFGFLILIIPLFRWHRWLDLLSIDDPFASGRGLNSLNSRMLLLVLASLFCALSVSLLGPIAFIGLMAPHAARLLGAVSAAHLLLLSALIGGQFMVFANKAGQVLFYPINIPTGILAALLSGVAFLVLMGISQRRVKAL